MKFIVVQTNATFFVGHKPISFAAISELRAVYKQNEGYEPTMIRMHEDTWKELMSQKEIKTLPMPVTHIMGMKVEVEYQYEKHEWRVGIMKVRKEVSR